MDINQKLCFAQGIAHLLQYQTSHGNLDVDEKYITSDKFSLGEFVCAVRDAGSKGTLETWQKKKLQSIGFAYVKADQPWTSMFVFAKEHIKNNNGKLPRATERTTEDVLVGAWVRQQTYLFRHLSQEKQQMLTDIGIKPYDIRGYHAESPTGHLEGGDSL